MCLLSYYAVLWNAWKSKMEKQQMSFIHSDSKYLCKY